jgi:deoxyribodipyrimidine photo-lyase
MVFKEGENTGLDRLNYYLDFIHDYKSTRDNVEGMDNSIKFSSYLSIGAISPKMIYHKIKEEESEIYSLTSSYWIYFELLWRDFFFF